MDLYDSLKRITCTESPFHTLNILNNNLAILIEAYELCLSVPNFNDEFEFEEDNTPEDFELEVQPVPTIGEFIPIRNNPVLNWASFNEFGTFIAPTNRSSQ